MDRRDLPAARAVLLDLCDKASTTRGPMSPDGKQAFALLNLSLITASATEVAVLAVEKYAEAMADERRAAEARLEVEEKRHEADLQIARAQVDAATAQARSARAMTIWTIVVACATTLYAVVAVAQLILSHRACG